MNYEIFSYVIFKTIILEEEQRNKINIPKVRNMVKDKKNIVNIFQLLKKTFKDTIDYGKNIMIYILKHYQII